MKTTLLGFRGFRPRDVIGARDAWPNRMDPISASIPCNVVCNRFLLMMSEGRCGSMTDDSACPQQVSDGAWKVYEQKMERDTGQIIDEAVQNAAVDAATEVCKKGGCGAFVFFQEEANP